LMDILKAAQRVVHLEQKLAWLRAVKKAVLLAVKKAVTWA